MACCLHDTRNVSCQGTANCVCKTYLGHITKLNLLQKAFLQDVAQVFSKAHHSHLHEVFRKDDMNVLDMNFRFRLRDKGRIMTGS